MKKQLKLHESVYFHVRKDILIFLVLMLLLASCICGLYFRYNYLEEKIKDVGCYKPNYWIYCENQDINQYVSFYFTFEPVKSILYVVIIMVLVLLIIYLRKICME